jgi:hypothetical protein
LSLGRLVVLAGVGRGRARSAAALNLPRALVEVLAALAASLETRSRVWMLDWAGIDG